MVYDLLNTLSKFTHSRIHTCERTVRSPDSISGLRLLRA